MTILLNEKEIITAIAQFYRIKEEYIKADDEGNYDITLPENAQITIALLKGGK